MDDFKNTEETERTYKQINSLQKDRFEEEWEREERREKFTFMVFGVLIVVLILVITGGLFFLIQMERAKSFDGNIQISDNGIGNAILPGVADNQEMIVTPQLFYPDESVSGNPSQEDMEKPNNGISNNQMDTSEFVIPDSDVRYLVSADLNELTAWEIRIARNEIYARHGRMFDVLELREYFESKSWYVPEIPAVEFNISCLSNVELENLNFIIHYEKAHNLN